MEGAWLISYVALWCVVLLLAVVALAHSRLLGILHHRVGPAGARPLADGPNVGSQLDTLAARNLEGGRWEWHFPSSTGLLAVFVSPQCQACNELMPHVGDYQRRHPDLPVVLVSTVGDAGMNRAYVAYRRLQKMNYVAGPELAERMNIEGTPYAVCVDRQGRVVGKGLVNQYEHLQSLYDAALGAAFEKEPAAS